MQAPGSLWLNVRTRGPAEAPGTSSTRLLSSRGRRGCRAPPVRSIGGPEPPFSGFASRPGMQGSGAIALALNGGPSQPAAVEESSRSASRPTGAAQRGRVTISYEDEEAYVAIPASTAKTLKINMDLNTYRARQARIKARMSLDKEERRQLLKEAEDSLRRCLQLDPADPRTYVVLGKILLQQKRYDEARRLYSEGTVATANNSPYIWSSWGWLEFKTGNISAARKLFDAAVVVDEQHACAWHKWGMLERSEGNYMRARDLWMQGIQKCRRKTQSQNAYLYNALAVMAAQVGRVEEARAWFEEGTRTLEGAASVALWQAWAVLEAKQGDPTAVRYLFKRALGVNPKSRYVHLAWAMWERKQRNVELCIQLLRRGQQLNPTDPAIYQAWAIVEKDRGEFDRAAELFEQGIQADPGHLHLWQAWGCMECERGNLVRARQLFQDGVWADPRSRDTVYIFHAWGVLEKDNDNVPFARELFKAALKVDPKNDSVWSTWIRMEEELGLLDRADDLRARQAEQQWEFEVPYNFTTRPRESPLAGLMQTLSNFFSLREKASNAEMTKPRRSADDGRSLRELLPDDFTDTLTVEDIIPSLKASRKVPLSLEDQFQSAKQQSVPQQQQRPSLPGTNGAVGEAAAMAAATAAAAQASSQLAAAAAVSAAAAAAPPELTEQQKQELRDRERERELLQLIMQDDDDDLVMAPGVGAGAIGGFSGSVMVQGPSSPLPRPPASAGAPVRPTLAAKQ